MERFPLLNPRSTVMVFAVLQVFDGSRRKMQRHIRRTAFKLSMPLAWSDSVDGADILCQPSSFNRLSSYPYPSITSQSCHPMHHFLSCSIPATGRHNSLRERILSSLQQQPPGQQSKYFLCCSPGLDRNRLCRKKKPQASPASHLSCGWKIFDGSEIERQGRFNSMRASGISAQIVGAGKSINTRQGLSDPLPHESHRP